MPKEMPLNHNPEIAYSVLEKISTRTETRISELPPLYNVLDAEALNRLISESDGDLELRFRYAGFEVRVDANQEISLADR